MADVRHLLARRTGSAPQAKGVPQSTLWVRCGASRPLRPGDRLPADVTGAHGAVTCSACLDPPSWAEAGIPT